MWVRTPVGPYQSTKLEGRRAHARRSAPRDARGRAQRQSRRTHHGTQSPYTHSHVRSPVAGGLCRSRLVPRTVSLHFLRSKTTYYTHMIDTINSNSKSCIACTTYTLTETDQRHRPLALQSAPSHASLLHNRHTHRDRTLTSDEMARVPAHREAARGRKRVRTEVAERVRSRAGYRGGCECPYWPEPRMA